MRKLACVVLLLVGAVREADACTTFCLRDGGQLVFGKNYDWDVGDGMAVVNKRNVAKASFDGGTPVHRWTSRHGSITFNQYGREQPNGGMNEKGLVVELMWLNETRYPEPDDRPAVGCLEWIQIQLDSFTTVREVLDHAADLRITSRAPLHYLTCDASGQCASIELLDGKLVAHTGDELPVSALTNDTYDNSMAELRKHEGFGGSEPLPETRGSLERFVRAASFVKRHEPSQPAVQHAFETLDAVANGTYTKWSIVYDLASRKIHFRTLQNREIRNFALASFDFACGTPVRVLDIDAAGSGDVTSSFVDYSTQSNRQLIGMVFSQIDFLQGVSAAELDAMARAPEAMACQDGSGGGASASGQR